MEGESDDITATSANRKCSALTGSARKTKDNAADWHNLLVKWEKFNAVGFNITTKIVNIKLSLTNQQPVDESSSLPVGGASELQEECRKLQEIVDKMVAMVTKMEHLMTSQQGMKDLEDFQFGPEGRKIPLFHTWTMEQITRACSVLWGAFHQELQLKQTILQEVAHTSDHNLDLVFLSCWIHQPYMEPQTRQELEALLLETGHRPL